MDDLLQQNDTNFNNALHQDDNVMTYLLEMASKLVGTKSEYYDISKAIGNIPHVQIIVVGTTYGNNGIYKSLVMKYRNRVHIITFTENNGLITGVLG